MTKQGEEEEEAARKKENKIKELPLIY